MDVVVEKNSAGKGSILAMKILLLTRNYPPDPIVGAFRAAKIADALSGEGHRVDVITARGPDGANGSRTPGPGLHVHTVRCIPNPQQIYVWAKQKLGWNSKEEEAETTPTAARSNAFHTADNSTIPDWKRIILSLLWIPDDQQGFIAPSIFRSLPVLLRGADLVYTTGPPFSVHLSGLFLKVLFGIRWAAEFRDPWADNPERAQSVRSLPADKINRWLEKLCLDRADHVITVAKATRDLLATKMAPARQDRLVLALNGIDRFTHRRPSSEKEGIFRIVYTGSFRSGRDPRSFLEALSKLKRELSLAPDELRVEFISRSHRYHGVSIEGLARRLDVSDLVDFVEWMPQEHCRQRIADADLLLLLFRDHRSQIPNKLYDYLGAQRPILAMVDPDGEAADMLRQVGGHYLVYDNTAAAMETALRAAITGSDHDDQRGTNSSLLREWSTEQQMKHLLTALELDSGPKA